MAGKSEGRKAGKAGRSRQGGARNSSRGEGSDEKGGYSRTIRARQVAKNTKKSGCVPKLFVLLLPFVAFGTYLFLRS